jgi:hypothetical protein
MLTLPEIKKALELGAFKEKVTLGDSDYFTYIRTS